MRDRVADDESAAVVGDGFVSGRESRCACAQTAGDRRGGRKVLREVARALQGVRHDRVEGLRVDFTQSAVAAEEEDPVLPRRAADGCAEAIAVQRGACGLQIAVGVEVCFLVELENGTVNLIGAGLRDDRNDTGAGAAIFGAEVVGVHCELLDGVRVRDDVAGGAHTGHVEAAVQVVRYLAHHVVGRPVDDDVFHGKANGVFVLHVLHAGSEIEQGVRIAIHKREVIDLSGC